MAATCCTHWPQCTHPHLHRVYCQPQAPASAAQRRAIEWGRPWEMVLVVYGFPTQVQALQFEWAWQHPTKSKVARLVHQQLTTHQRTGLAGKIRLLLGMLCASPWRYYPLTLQFLSQQHSTLPKGAASLPARQRDARRHR
ncbi:hypothetical protein COO60DRAFT_223547 [Scenedesmus sp. NREL 46B-D3]|nr:hypothetical protein COO60DRAFT_223547 [Scenedesmus sp. NREL 46B-D3]